MVGSSSVEYCGISLIGYLFRQVLHLCRLSFKSLSVAPASPSPQQLEKLNTNASCLGAACVSALIKSHERLAVYGLCCTHFFFTNKYPNITRAFPLITACSLPPFIRDLNSRLQYGQGRRHLGQSCVFLVPPDSLEEGH